MNNKDSMKDMWDRAIRDRNDKAEEIKSLTERAKERLEDIHSVKSWGVCFLSVV
jgi:hypothetical protein